MSQRDLILKIVDALEAHGLSRDEYQLYRWVAVEALERLVASANDDLKIRLSVAGFHLLVSQSGVWVLSSSSEESNCRDRDEDPLNTVIDPAQGASSFDSQVSYSKFVIYFVEIAAIDQSGHSMGRISRLEIQLLSSVS